LAPAPRSRAVYPPAIDFGACWLHDLDEPLLELLVDGGRSSALRRR
jgi:hypothetical protein